MTRPCKLSSHLSKVTNFCLTREHVVPVPPSVCHFSQASAIAKSPIYIHQCLVPSKTKVFTQHPVCYFFLSQIKIPRWMFREFRLLEMELSSGQACRRILVNCDPIDSSVYVRYFLELILRLLFFNVLTQISETQQRFYFFLIHTVL